MHLRQLRGSWALVTGASSGIGVGFCRSLAASGLNLVLVARRRLRMEALATDLQRLHGTRTLVLPADLSRRGVASEICGAVRDAGIRLRMLVNNAAFGPWGRFEDNPAEMYEAVAQLVLATPTALCREFRADLATHDWSVVINVSSPAALQPVPYKALYAAAKTALHHFSLALHEEWRPQQIYVQTLVPGPTRTELDRLGKAYKCGLTSRRAPPEKVVQASLSRLAARSPLVSTHRGTYKQRVFNGLFPYRAVLWELERMFRPPASSAPTPEPGE